jgi:RNA polymerase sigma-70 factor, ECF subfamily
MIMSMQQPTTDRLERFRDYLTLLARTQIGVKYQRKIDASAVVNVALLRAHEQRDQFRGSNDAELAAWLRRVLASRLAEAFRALHRGKRDIEREQLFEVDFDQSCTRLEDWLVAMQTSPSVKAIRSEQLMRLAWALGELPDEQREVVELRHLHACAVSQIAHTLGRSQASVAGLLRRGLKRLRELLEEPDSRM